VKELRELRDFGEIHDQEIKNLAFLEFLKENLKKNASKSKRIFLKQLEKHVEIKERSKLKSKENDALKKIKNSEEEENLKGGVETVEQKE